MDSTTEIPTRAMYLHGDLHNRRPTYFCDHHDAFRGADHFPCGVLEADVKRYKDTIRRHGERGHEPTRPNLFAGVVVPRPTRPRWVWQDEPEISVLRTARRMGASAFRYYDALQEIRAVISWALGIKVEVGDFTHLVEQALHEFKAGQDEARLIYEPHWFFPALHPDEEGMLWAEMCALSEKLEEVA